MSEPANPGLPEICMLIDVCVLSEGNISGSRRQRNCNSLV